MHDIAVDNASGLGCRGRGNFAIDAVKRRDHAIGVLAAEGLAPAFAKIETFFMLLKTRRAGEPFALGLFLGKGLEHARWRMLPVAGDGEAGMGDGTRHSSFSFDIM